MSNGLTLPFFGSATTSIDVFQITQGDSGPPTTGAGGTAIAGYSYGMFDNFLPSTGVLGYSDVGYGVYGLTLSDTNEGVHGESTGGNGVVGLTGGANSAGVYGQNWNYGDGVTGVSPRNGVHGVSTSSTDSGVWGENQNSGFGVAGSTASRDYWTGAGVWGANYGFGVGVKGTSTNSDGVLGITSSGEASGVIGINSDGSAFGTLGGFLQSVPPQPPVGVFGANWNLDGYAAYFAGNVWVTGFIWKSFSFFRIDHPLDPANKFLNHSAVEAAELKTIYDGCVVLDRDGQATVELPLWFEALNHDFRYQLTAVGTVGPNLHVAEEISKNRFKIAGGKPGSKVCWQVTGVRHDPHAKAHTLSIEQEKTPAERGKYLYPEGYGASAERGLDWELRHKLEQRAPRSTSAGG